MTQNRTGTVAGSCEGEGGSRLSSVASCRQSANACNRSAVEKERRGEGRDPPPPYRLAGYSTLELAVNGSHIVASMSGPEPTGIELVAWLIVELSGIQVLMLSVVTMTAIRSNWR